MYSDYQGHQANDLSPLLVKFTSCTWRIVRHVIVRLHPRGSQSGERNLNSSQLTTVKSTGLPRLCKEEVQGSVALISYVQVVNG